MKLRWKGSEEKREERMEEKEEKHEKVLEDSGMKDVAGGDDDDLDEGDGDCDER